MDWQRFEDVARAFAPGISRRGMVGALAGTAMGGLLVAAGAGEAGARNRKKRKKKRGGAGEQGTQCTTCSETCPGAAESNPVKTLVFTPTGADGFCGVAVKLTGFAGCTEYTAEYWSALNLSGFREKDNGDVTLGPTDLSGASQTDLGTFVEGGAIDIRIGGVATGYQYVEC